MSDKNCFYCKWGPSCVLTVGCNFEAKAGVAQASEAPERRSTGECNATAPEGVHSTDTLAKGIDLIDTPATSTQIGGNHYRDMTIQPAEFIHKNGIEFLPGCVIKRMCRWRKKDGLKDLRKAIHEIELMIEFEEQSCPRTQASGIQP